MNEQSHKDEMAAALRGDFARLRARGVEPTLVPEATVERAVGEPAVEASPTARPTAPSWLDRLRGRS